MIIDDRPEYVHGGIERLIQRIGRTDEIVQLTRPNALPEALQNHPDTDLVLVDMHFDNSRRSGLTALEYLASRPDEAAPPAVGFSAPEDNRLLYPYAACQLLPRPPIGWILKNSFDQAELVHIISRLDSGEQPESSRTLKAFLPAHPLTGNLMSSILSDEVDLRIWQMLSLRPHSDADVAAKIYMSAGTVRYRYRQYHAALVDLQQALHREDTFDELDDQPFQWMRGWEAFDEDAKKLGPVISQFALSNKEFFKSPELPELVKARSSRRKHRFGLKRQH